MSHSPSQTSCCCSQVGKSWGYNKYMFVILQHHIHIQVLWTAFGHYCASWEKFSVISQIWTNPKVQLTEKHPEQRLEPFWILCYLLLTLHHSGLHRWADLAEQCETLKVPRPPSVVSTTVLPTADLPRLFMSIFTSPDHPAEVFHIFFHTFSLRYKGEASLYFKLYSPVSLFIKQ